MVYNGKYSKGYDHYVEQETGAGGEYFIVMGILLLIISYLSLSPFGLIRRFFERKRKH